MAPKNPRNNKLRKASLIPLWICQFCPLLLFLVIDCMNLTLVLTIWALVLVFLFVLCIVCNIVEIVLFARQKLRPTTYLVLQIVKTKIWLIMFLISIVPNQLAIGSIIDTTTLLAVFLSSLIYACVIVHYQRRLKNSPFAFNKMYARHVSKDSMFGDRVELVEPQNDERPRSALVSKSDQRYQEHV